MRTLGLLMCITFIIPAASLSQITFERTYGGDEDDVGLSGQQTADGGYIITGQTASFGLYSWDVYLIRTDSYGDTLWTRTYGGNNTDLGISIQQTADGGYVIVGDTRSFGAGNTDVYLIRTDSLGDTLWTRTYGGGENDGGHSVQQTTDGGYVIAGITESFGAGLSDFYLIKTDSSGDTLWTKTYGGEGADGGWSVQQTTDGGYVVAGSREDDVYIVKTDLFGDTLWTRTFGGNDSDKGSSVQQTTDGGYIIAGFTNSFGAGDFDVYLSRTNATGNILWTRTYGGINEDRGYSVIQTNDGGYVIAGCTKSFGAGGYDVYLLKTDSSGDTLWTRTYGDSLMDEASSVQQTTDGGYIIAAYEGDDFLITGDVLLVKTNPDGLVGISDYIHPSPELPRSWTLSQNFPNPFNPSTTISLEVPGNSATKQKLTLAVHDIRGRLVRILIDSKLESGSHKIHWDGQNDRGQSVASGIYLYQLKAGGETFTRKMTVLK